METEQAVYKLFEEDSQRSQVEILDGRLKLLKFLDDELGIYFDGFVIRRSRLVQILDWI